jgi:hypothetical protein
MAFGLRAVEVVDGCPEYRASRGGECDAEVVGEGGCARAIHPIDSDDDASTRVEGDDLGGECVENILFFGLPSGHGR